MPQYFTKEGLKKIKDELAQLKGPEMRRIVKLIAEAAAFGDLKENSAYHDARNMKSFLLGRIEQLEAAINDSVVREKSTDGKVQIGSQVTIDFAGETVEYEVVGPTEADILKNKISYQSPLGKLLMGKVAKDAFTYEINGKKIAVKILKIS